MVKTTQYASESAIGPSRPGAKLNFGGNLYMRVSRSGERVFHFRVCLDGKDTTHSIGKYPDLNLAQARQIASLRQSEVMQARKESAVIAFRKSLSTVKQKPASRKPEALRDTRTGSDGAGFVGFRSLEEAGKFVLNLQKSRHLMSQEMYIWLRLRIMIPSRSDFLIGAMWRDLDKQTGVWTVRRGSKRPTAVDDGPRQVSYLSQRAESLIDELWQATGTGAQLFPTLKNTPAPALRFLIREAVAIVWPQYHIDPREFAAFFESAAMKYSYFRPDLVDAALAHKPGNKVDYNHGTYVIQLRALADWWAGTLEWFAFGESVVRWGGTYVPLRLDHGRSKWSLS